LQETAFWFSGVPIAKSCRFKTRIEEREKTGLLKEENKFFKTKKLAVRQE
jgi:hypothetical protein